MAKKTGPQASFHLGDRVRIKGLAGQVGRIIELRGPLGPGGAPVYRVRIWRKPRRSEIELLGDQMEFAPAAEPADELPGEVNSTEGQQVP